MREIKVISEQVDALSEGLERGGDIVKVEVDEIVESLFGAGVEGWVVIGAGDEAVHERVQVREGGRPVVVGDRSITFDLRITESEEAEGGDAKGWRMIGVGVRRVSAGKMKLYSLKPCAEGSMVLGSSRGKRESAG